MKDLTKDILDLGGASLFMGATARISSSIGGTAGNQGAAAMGNLSRFLPTMGSLAGFKATTKMLKKLKI